MAIDEFTNRELGLLLTGIKKDIKESKEENKEHFKKFDKVIFGNGKPGIMEEITCVKLWKSRILGGFAVMTAFVLPLFFIVIGQFISKLF